MRLFCSLGNGKRRPERSEKRVILYHRTTRKNAEAIAKEGFKDATGTYFTDQEFSGVWVSDVPLDANEGAHGDVLFELTLKLPEAMISGYEWVGEGKGYREWPMPAAVLNSHATLMEVSDAEAEVQTRKRADIPIRTP